MKLEELIDIEAQLAADQETPEDALRARDRKLFQQLPQPPPSDDRGLLRAWIDALPQRTRLGKRLVQGQRLASWALILFGLSSGGGLCSWLLLPLTISAAQKPQVQLVRFALVLIVPQLLLLALLLVGLLVSRWLPEPPWIRDLRDLLRALAGAFERLVARGLDQAQRDRLAGAKSRLATRNRLYLPVERWVLMRMFQTFGVAFNVGALAVLIFRSTGGALAFGWSSTLDLQPEALLRITDVLTAPWGWALPSFVPDLALIRNTRATAWQPSRLEGDTWWGVLSLVLLVYGLLPRLGTWALASWRLHRALCSVPIDTPDLERLLRRMRTPIVQTVPAPPQPPIPQSSIPQSSIPQPSHPREAKTDRASAAPQAAKLVSQDASQPAVSTPYAVVLWRDVPLDAHLLDRALARFHGAVSTTLEASHAAANVLQTLTAQRDRVLIVCETDGGAPDSGLRRFLKKLRAQLPSERIIHVGLLNRIEEQRLIPPDAQTLALWRDRLALLEDPYLSVEVMETA